MLFERIDPLVHKTDLGHLRPWRDDLAKVIGLVQQLHPKSTSVAQQGSGAARLRLMWDGLAPGDVRHLAFLFCRR